jgi:O-antigen/teichoic acid export membrane protein
MTDALDAPRYSLRKLLGSSIIYTASDLALKVLGFFLIPLYTRVLSPADYGVIGYVTGLIQVLSPLVGLGLVNSLPPLYHTYTGRERDRLISSVLNFSLLYGLAITALLTVMGGLLFSNIAKGVPFSPYMVVGLWTIFVTNCYFLPLGIFNMTERPMAYAAYSLCISAFGILLNILFVLVLRMGALGSLWAGLINGIVGMVLTLYVVRRSYMPIIDRSKLMEVLRFALPALPHLFSGTIWRFADRFFLVGLVTLSATGVYSLAQTIASIVLMALGGMTTALNPLFYRRASAQDPTLPQDWAHLCSLFAAGAAYVALGLTLLGPFLIVVMTPVKYHEAIPLLPSLVLGQLFIGLGWLVSAGLNHTRKTWVYPVASMLAMSVTVSLNLMLVPRYGTHGAAWAMVGSAGLQAAVLAVLSQRYFPIPYEWSKLGKIGLLTVVTLVLANLPVAGMPTVVAAIAALVLLPVLMVAAGVLSPTEKTALLSRLPFRRPVVPKKD